MYVLVFIQNYWYEILLVPATWYMILHILYLVISSSSMREILRFYTAIVWFLTNLVWLISLRIIITEWNDFCWIYACFLLKTNLFFKLHNILYIWILSDILLCEIILWELNVMAAWFLCQPCIFCLYRWWRWHWYQWSNIRPATGGGSNGSSNQTGASPVIGWFRPHHQEQIHHSR